MVWLAVSTYFGNSLTGEKLVLTSLFHFLSVLMHLFLFTTYYYILVLLYTSYYDPIPTFLLSADCLMITVERLGLVSLCSSGKREVT